MNSKNSTTNTPAQSHWGAIVIGAGMGGLASAAYLAANGVRTLVLEAGEVIGGCTHVFRRNGFEFEVGVHYLGDCERPEAPIPSILRGVGLDKRISFREIDPDGFDTLDFPSVRFSVPRTWDAYERNLVAAFPEQKRALRRYVKILRRMAEAMDRGTTGVSTRALREFIRKTGVYAPLAMIPLESVVRWCGVTGPARAVLCGQTPAYAAPAYAAPMIVQAGFLRDYIDGGAYFPQGGGQMLSAGLREVIEANSGAVRMRSRVEQILIESGRATGVRTTDGYSYFAPIVISNADLKKTYRDLVGPTQLPARVRRRVEKYKMAWPLFNVYMGLDIDLSDRMTSAQIWKFRTDEEFGAIQKALDYAQFKGDREAWLDACRAHLGAMIHIATNKDPVSGLAPEGFSSIEAMSYVPADPDLWGLAGLDPSTDSSYRKNPIYQQMKDEVTDIIVSLVEEVVPDVRDHIVWLEAGTPATQERYTLSTEGGSYGIEMNRRQLGPLRQGPKTPIRGLYIAGASSAWGPGVCGAMLSGVGAASAALHRNLLAEVRAGAVFGDTAALPDRSEQWDPLAAATLLPVKGGKLRTARTVEYSD